MKTLTISLALIFSIDYGTFPRQYSQCVMFSAANDWSAEVNRQDTARSGTADSAKHQLRRSSILIEEVYIRGKRNYKRDSIRFREYFQSEFGYRPVKIKDVFIPKVTYLDQNPIPHYVALNNTSSLLGVDLLSVINLIGKKDSKKKIQQELLNDEWNRFIDEHFSEEKVEQMTGLKNDSLRQFMDLYRPTMEDVSRMTAYEILVYIKKSYEAYKSGH